MQLRRYAFLVLLIGCTTTSPEKETKPVQGGLSRQEILGVIDKNIDQIRDCYEELLKRLPKAEGRLVANFAIGPTGSVTSAILEGDPIDDPTMRACVVHSIMLWKFPKPRGASKVDVSYPFVFTPDAEESGAKTPSK